MDTAPAGKEAWQEVLNSALEGDIQQLGRLCQEYLRPKLYPFALTLLKNSHDAEDVVQEVFERLLTYYQRVRNHDLKGFEAVVMTMVRNGCRDVWKKKNPTESLPDNLPAATTPQEEVTRMHLLASLCHAIQQNLTEAEQELFEMKVVQGLKYEMISKKTGIPVATLHNHYQKILLKIDKHGELREYWEKIKGK